MTANQMIESNVNVNVNRSNTVEVKVLSTDQIKAAAPFVYATAPTNPNLSKYYTFASTEAVINDMNKLGWKVVSANQVHPRRRNAVNSFHCVTFRSDMKISRTLADGTPDYYYPEVILTNSHDGFTSFCFRIGLYRPLTNRSLAVATSNFENVRLRHMGYSFDELRNLVNQIIAEIPTQVEVMNKMQNRLLTTDEQRVLALAALRNRQNNDELEVSDFILDGILVNDSNLDTDDSIWSVFNRIMDKMLEGDFQIEGKKGLRKARKIKGIWKTINLSQAVFKAAAGFIK